LPTERVQDPIDHASGGHGLLAESRPRNDASQSAWRIPRSTTAVDNYHTYIAKYIDNQIINGLFITGVEAS